MSDTYSFEGLIIERVITHKVFARNENRETVQPKISNSLITLSATAKATLQNRLTKALGDKSHGMEVSIEKTDENSFFHIASNILHCSDQDFITQSAQFADKLTDAQCSTNAPSGLLIIVKGRVGQNSVPFLCVIKAEPQDGFNAKESDDGSISMEYLEELLLTEASKLYKIGFLVNELPRPQEEIDVSNYRAFLFDHLMTKTETRSAAAYFYQNFLGMSISQSSKKLTKLFYDKTKQFIDSSDLTDEEKIDKHEALRVYLQSNHQTISSNDFATQYLPQHKQRDYNEFMKVNKFPTNSVNKDNELIQNLLRRKRQYNFNNGVKITTPANGETKDYFKYETDIKNKCTIVTINGILQNQR